MVECRAFHVNRVKGIASILRGPGRRRSDERIAEHRLKDPVNVEPGEHQGTCRGGEQEHRQWCGQTSQREQPDHQRDHQEDGNQQKSGGHAVTHQGAEGEPRGLAGGLRDGGAYSQAGHYTQLPPDGDGGRHVDAHGGATEYDAEKGVGHRLGLGEEIGQGVDRRRADGREHGDDTEVNDDAAHRIFQQAPGLPGEGEGRPE